MKTNTNSSAINPAANCSAVLGGFNNKVNHPFAAIFGNGLTTVAPNTFHVECLNALNTPLGSSWPVGTIYYELGATLGYGPPFNTCKFLFVK